MRKTHLLSECSLIHTMRVSRAKPLSPIQRREAIIAATTDLVLKHGPDATTRQIADACGIAEGTLFRVFESKDEILDAVIEALVDPQHVIEKIQELDPAINCADAVRMLADVYGASTTRIHAVMVALRTNKDDKARHGHPPHDKTRMIEGQESIGVAIAAVLEPHQEELRVDTATAAMFIRTVVFASSFPFTPKINDRSVFNDLLIHALVKEPECSITR